MLIFKSLLITEFGFNCDTFCFWYIKHSFTSSISNSITCIIISTCTSIFKLVYSVYPPRTKFRGYIGITLSVLSAGIYRWPNPPDELWVSLSDIPKRIPEPLPNGRSKRMIPPELRSWGVY
jgi:hypothetical protein